MSERADPCRFYRLGTCKNGASCQFLHADCKFFAAGNCKNGDDCPFRHSEEMQCEVAPAAPAVSSKQQQANEQARLVAVSQAPRAFALDCEFIEVRQGKGEALRHYKVTVSVGVVSEQLETILYARVKQPPRTQVFDDAFARTQGKLEPDWALGVRLEVAQVPPPPPAP